MQPAERPESADRHRNDVRQAGHDPSIEKEPAAGYLANVGESLGSAVLVAAPTEPKVTDVTAASTSSVLVRNDQGIATWMLPQPLTRGIVEVDLERVRHRGVPGRIPSR